jgi:hypothetical protein
MVDRGFDTPAHQSLLQRRTQGLRRALLGGLTKDCEDSPVNLLRRRSYRMCRMGLDDPRLRVVLGVQIARITNNPATGEPTQEHY